MWKGPHGSPSFFWKPHNSLGHLCRSPEEIVSSYRFPTLKVMDLVRKEGEHTTVLFLSKVET